MNIVFNQEMACTHTKHAFCIYNSDRFFVYFFFSLSLFCLLGAYWVIRSDSCRIVYCMYINRQSFYTDFFREFWFVPYTQRNRWWKNRGDGFGVGRIIKSHIPGNDLFCNWNNAKCARQYRSNLFDNIIVSIVQYWRRSISIFESQLCYVTFFCHHFHSFSLKVLMSFTIISWYCSFQYSALSPPPASNKTVWIFTARYMIEISIFYRCA